MVVCNGIVFEDRAAAKAYFGVQSYGGLMALAMEPYDDGKHGKLLKRQTRQMVVKTARKAPVARKPTNGEAWAAVRKQILAMDEYVCRVCGNAPDDKSLDVHHIDRSRLNNKLSNLVSLCGKCHKSVHATNYIAGTDAYDGGSAWGFLAHRA